MKVPFISNLSPIGLDLGVHSFKAVQIKRIGSGWMVHRTLSLARVTPDGPITASDLARLRDVLDRRGFAGSHVVIAIPANKLLTAMLELPPRGPGVPIEQIAGLEFGRVHKKDPALLTMSTWELPAPARAGKATYMLGVGAPASELESHIDLIESADLNVIAIDEPHSAAARGTMHMVSAGNGLTGIVDLGWSAATLTITMNNSIVYTRRLGDAGLKSFCQQVESTGSGDLLAAQIEIWKSGLISPVQTTGEDSSARNALNSHVEDMLKEVAQALSYASRRYSDANIAQAILIGGGAAIPGIAQAFAASLGTPTICATIGCNPKDTNDASSDLSSALGLALWPGGMQ